jgi:hypothetical protein
MLFYFAIIQQLVEETSRYYHQYLDMVDEGWSPMPDVTVQVMCLFLAIIVQVGHDQRDMLKGYWSTTEQYFMAIYSSHPKKT